MADFFMEGATLQSENGQMVYDLVYRLSLQFRGEIPKGYEDLLSELGKYSGVSGYLQPTGPAALHKLQVKTTTLLWFVFVLFPIDN